MVEADKILARPTCSGPQAARLLGLSMTTIYAGLRRGDIPATRVGGRYLIPTSWVSSVIRAPGTGQAA